MEFNTIARWTAGLTIAVGFLIGYGYHEREVVLDFQLKSIHSSLDMESKVGSVLTKAELKAIHDYAESRDTNIEKYLAISNGITIQEVLNSTTQE